MKNRLFIMLVASLIISILTVPTVYASECPGAYSIEENVVYLSDGSYIVKQINKP